MEGFNSGVQSILPIKWMRMELKYFTHEELFELSFPLDAQKDGLSLKLLHGLGNRYFGTGALLKYFMSVTGINPVRFNMYKYYKIVGDVKTWSLCSTGYQEPVNPLKYFTFS